MSLWPLLHQPLVEEEDAVVEEHTSLWLLVHRPPLVQRLAGVPQAL